MKRECKFKLWDSRTSTMSYNNFVIHGATGFVFEGANENSSDFVIPLEYLPIYDKNNKQYCEGDIVYTSYGNLVVRYGKTKGVIGWALYDSLHAESGCALINDDYEIIGNIYENPEIEIIN